MARRGSPPKTVRLNLTELEIKMRTPRAMTARAGMKGKPIPSSSILLHSNYFRNLAFTQAGVSSCIPHQYLKTCKTHKRRVRSSFTLGFACITRKEVRSEGLFNPKCPTVLYIYLHSCQKSKCSRISQLSTIATISYDKAYGGFARIVRKEMLI